MRQAPPRQGIPDIDLTRPFAYVASNMHRNLSDFERALPHMRSAPADEGTVRAIVVRPKTDERAILSTGKLTPGLGLQGDNWGDSRPAEAIPTEAESSNQVSLMSSRVIAELAVTEDRWPLAGDNLYVDFDLSSENLPPGSRIKVGTALLEITGEPHTGCRKFSRRFGNDAVAFVNSAEGKQLNLRGIFARVLQAGSVRVGDAIKKLT